MSIKRSSFFAHHITIKYEDTQFDATLEVRAPNGGMNILILDNEENQVSIPLEALLHLATISQKAAHDINNFFLIFDSVLDTEQTSD